MKRFYDLVDDELDESMLRYGLPLYYIGERKRVLKGICKILDSIADRFGCVGDFCNVKVDEENEITISLVCHEFEISENNDEFYSLLLLTKSFSMKALDDKHIQMNFVFDGNWQGE